MLKLIGILSMICDHSSNIFIENFSYLNLIGRIAFPIFAFQLVIGYTNTKNIKKYVIRLLIFACISQIPFMLFLSTYTDNFLLNIFFTFLTGILAIHVYNKLKSKKFGILTTILFLLLICIIAEIIKVDYGAFGILLIFIFYLFKNNKVLMCFSFYILCFIRYLIYTMITPALNFYYLMINICTFLAIFFILLYNGKPGKKIKYFFYIFYPLHLIIFYIIKMVFFN